jgi:hypothetical protein
LTERPASRTCWPAITPTGHHTRQGASQRRQGNKQRSSRRTHHFDGRTGRGGEGAVGEMRVGRGARVSSRSGLSPRFGKSPARAGPSLRLVPAETLPSSPPRDPFWIVSYISQLLNNIWMYTASFLLFKEEAEDRSGPSDGPFRSDEQTTRRPS